MDKITFADFELPEKILDVLADSNLFVPTPIQEKSLKPILSGRDVMGIAQTGTGKTLAYLLPVLKNLEIQQKRQSYCSHSCTNARVGGAGN